MELKIKSPKVVWQFLLLLFYNLIFGVVPNMNSFFAFQKALELASCHLLDKIRVCIWTRMIWKDICFHSYSLFCYWPPFFFSGLQHFPVMMFYFPSVFTVRKIDKLGKFIFQIWCLYIMASTNKWDLRDSEWIHILESPCHRLVWMLISFSGEKKM